jgi:hypothetical protein
LSFTHLATQSEDSCIDQPRLYETVVQEGRGVGWEEDMVGGWVGRLPARGRDKGSRIGVGDIGGLHQKKHTHLEVDTGTKKPLCNYCCCVRLTFSL